MLKNQTPFQPFTVVPVNGDRLEVDHPDALAVREGLGGVFALFDHEGVSQIVGNMMGR